MENIFAKLQKSTHPIHCSFQLKLTALTVQQQLGLPSFIFTQIVIKGTDYQLIKIYHCVIPCTILCRELKKLLYMIHKLVHFDICITYSNQLHLYVFLCCKLA